MAGMTDTRIIQMQFDNAKFEKNIAKSQKSIEELKEAMDFEETSRGLRRFSDTMDALSFSNLTNNVQRITDKFTGLGNAGEYVLSRIRAGIEGAAQSMERFVKSMSIDQIEVGMSKYDALNKSVMTIISGGKYTEEEAYAVMERVMAYTDQTSHSFQTMVGQISALQAIGMDLEGAERFLEGVANSATQAGAGATEAAGAMSIISKIMGGASFLGKQQFDSLNQTYHVITSDWRKLAIEAGVATGNLEKKGEKIFTNSKFGKQVEVTVGDLENTLNKRWFTSDVAKLLYGNYQFGESVEELQHPEDVMDSFGKTAYLTGQRALTFADAMNAIKESVSSGWMDTFRILFGDVTEAAENFTLICDRVIESLEGIKDFRNSVMRSWQIGGGRDSFMSILIGDAYWETEKGTVGFIDLLDGLGKTVYTGFRDFLLLFASPSDRYAAETDPEYFQAWLGARLADITEGVQNFMQGIKDFFNEEIDVNGETKTRLEVIYEIVHGISGALGFAYMILEGVTHFMAQIGTQLKPGFDIIIGFFGDLGEKIFGAAQDAADQRTIFQFFDELAQKATPITTGINQIIGSVDKLLRTLLGLDKDGKDSTSTIQAIGDVILEVADTIGKIIGPILTFVSDIISLIADLAGGKIDFAGFLTGVGDSFETMFKSFLPDDLTLLPDWVKHLFGVGLEETEEEGNNFFDKVRTFFENNFGSFDKLLSNITSGFSLKAALESGFGFLSAFNFLSTVAGWFKTTNLYGIILAFLGVATLGSLFSLIMQARKAVRTIGGFFDDVGGNIKAGVLGHYEWNSEKVLNFAKGILMIAGAIMLLGSMDRGALIQGTIAVGLIFAALMLLVTIVGNDKFKANYGQQLAAAAIIDAIAVAIVAIVLSLSILMLAMIPLASDWKRMLTAVLGFTAIIAVLGGFIVIMLNTMSTFVGGLNKKGNWGKIGKLAVILILIAGVVAVLALSISTLMLAMAPLAAMGWKSVLAAVAALALILTSMGLFIVLMLGAMDKFISAIGGGTTSWSGIGKAAVMMLLLAGTVAILCAGLSTLMIALAPLAAMSWQSITAAVIGLGVILTEIGLFMVIMLNVLDDFAFKAGGGKSGAVGIVKIAALMAVLSLSVALLSVGLALLITAITPLAMMSAEGVVKAVAGLGVILFELGLFISYLNNMNDGRGASVKLLSFAGFALSIGILVLALTPLALMSWEGWAKAMAGLTIVLGELIATMAIMKRASISTVSLAGFAGFAVSIGILIFALQPLAGMDWGGWARAMAGLAVVLLELIGAMKLMDMAEVNTGALFGFIGFALSIAILIFALKPLAEMDTDGYMRAMVGLATVMLEVILFIGLLNVMKPDLASAGSALLILIGLGVSMILFGIAFNEVKDVPWQNIVGFAAGISLLLVAIAGASLLAKAGGISGMLVLVVGLAAVIGVLALLAPVLINSVGSALTKLAAHLTLISNLMKTFSGNMGGVDEGNIDKGERILTKLKNLFTGLFGFTFVGNSITTFTRAIAQLNLMSDQLTTFDRRISSLSDDGGVGKFKAIVEEIEDMFITGSMSKFSNYAGLANSFSTVMYQLGTAAGTFEYNTQSVGDPDQNNGLKTILAIAGAANQLDTISKLNLDDLTAKISGLGGAMMLYAMGAEQVGALESGETPDVTAAVQLMQEISTSLNENGGFAIPSDMPDDQQLTLFGASLAALAGALVQFEQAGAGLGDGTDKALEVIGFFQQLKTKLETTDFFSNIGYIITNGGSSEGMADRTSVLTTFGNNISQLAQSMGQFANSTTYLDEASGEIKTFDYSNAIKAMESIADISTKLPSFGGPIEIITGTREDLGTFAAEIELLGSALKDFHNNTTVMDETNANPPEFDYSNAIGALQDIAVIPGSMPMTPGFIPRLWEGNPPSLTELATDIIELGGALNEFSNSVNGTDDSGNEKFNPDAVYQAISVLDDFVYIQQDLQEKLPTVGGLVNIWDSITVGRAPKITDISGDLSVLGDDLASFAFSALNEDGTSKVTLEGIQPILDALDEFIYVQQDLQEKLPTVGGLVNIWDSITVGRAPKITDISGDLGTLGDDLGKFAAGALNEDGTAKVTTEGMQPTLDALDGMIAFMQEMQGKLPTVGGLVNILNTLVNGRKLTLGDLGAMLEPLGPGLAALGKGLNEGNWSQISDVSSAFDALEGLLQVMVKLEELTNLTGSGYVDFDRLTYFVEGLNDPNLFKTGFEDTDVQQSKTVVDYIVEFITTMNDALSVLGDNSADLELVKSRIEIFTLLAQGLNNLSNIKLDTGFSWTGIGTTIAWDVGEGIANGTATAVTDMMTLLTSIYTTGITHQDIDWTTIGSAVTDGIVLGINGGTEGVTAAATAIANAAYTAAMKALDANSPSEVFEKVGSYIGLGWRNGIQYTSDDVVNAAEDTVYAIMSVTDRDTIGGWMNELFNKGNVDLLTRPVIDAQKLVEAGWEEAGEGVATVFTNTYTAGLNNADYEWNRNVVVDFTPITPDGKVLSQGELEDYVWELFNSSNTLDEFINNDKAENGGLNLLIDYNVDFSSFDEAYEEMSKRAYMLHLLQDGFYPSENTFYPEDKIEGFMGLWSKALAESTDAQPTITPVLDMSQVEAKLAELGLRSYGGTIGIDTTSSANRAGYIASEERGTEEQAPPDYSGIYERINSVGEQLQNLSTAISNMKLVLNTGIVAGGVTNDVDRNIGRKMFYADRRN